MTDANPFMRLIPAIDLKDGHCVRLLRGDFGAETRYSADPRALLAKYREFGADWLHVVDLDGARDGRGGHRELIVELAMQTAVMLQVGGGLRDTDAVSQVLNAGVGRAVIGSAAVTDVDLVRTWLDDFGAERLVLAFDVRHDPAGTPRVAIHGWREQSTLSLWDAVANFEDYDLKHVLCTDVSRDGALSGPNVELYAEAVQRFPHIEWQASGGIRDARDLHALARVGAKAAISGKALLDNLIPLEDLQAFLPNASSPA
ncbi:MAG TPA: 1-(5-phosphoribosyl)-5-[(5-phosphoribosylamino)methylideneamino]imidazole-4-carboxamide isomerase [Steroidobacteraceae bacterium]|jgi:phosphoribosylformimino-5-aminoimidazole carboxamide ribotide isomerase|nr:1-(5-phosphoribosyl)-5-[(5-phosphoribosylamino)methylideneamino]imidazole-4-carboxamide isomerase [Steroidobacteraceae bacterium]